MKNWKKVIFWHKLLIKGKSIKLQIHKQSSKVTTHKYQILNSNTQIYIMSHINNKKQIAILNVSHKQHKTTNNSIKRLPR